MSSIISRVKSPLCSECNSLDFIKPSYIKEWDFEKNLDYDLKEISVGSGVKVNWKCSNGHSWITRVVDRKKGQNCPFCNAQTSKPEIRIFTELNKLFEDDIHRQSKVQWRKKIEGYEIDIYIPELKIGIEHDGSYFHKNQKSEEKNKFLSNQGIKIFHIREFPLKLISNFDIQYKAGEFTKSVFNKFLLKIKQFFNKDFEVKIFDYINKKNYIADSNFQKMISILPGVLEQDSLLIKFPSVAKEWDVKRNGKDPSHIAPFSSHLAWWKCRNGHSWQAKISNRTNDNKTCPSCRSLKFNYPHLYKEINKSKNPNLNAELLSKSSGRKIWWICSEAHEWFAAVNNRTRKNGTGCPKCSIRKNQFN
jgi:very-short-patch-repair endonuclease/translation initiation factor IF-1